MTLELLAFAILIQYLLTGLMISRLGIMPSWMCFVPGLMQYQLSKYHSLMKKDGVSVWLKVFAALLSHPMYTAYMGAEIRLVQGHDYLKSFLGIAFPIVFGPMYFASKSKLVPRNY